jgi:hypothetical protein
MMVTVEAGAAYGSRRFSSSHVICTQDFVTFVTDDGLTECALQVKCLLADGRSVGAEGSDQF